LKRRAIVTKEELELVVENAKAALRRAEDALLEWSDRAENNVFATMEEAEAAIENELLVLARDDCEGAYNCGADSYSRAFMVDGKKYVGTLTCEYNRHDKTYYYVDGHDFTVAEQVA
jgi:Tfp pilus assembly protein PilX